MRLQLILLNQQKRRIVILCIIIFVSTLAVISSALTTITTKHFLYPRISSSSSSSLSFRKNSNGFVFQRQRQHPTNSNMKRNLEMTSKDGMDLKSSSISMPSTETTTATTSQSQSQSLFLIETLNGLYGNVSEDIPISTLHGAIHVFRNMLLHNNNNGNNNNNNNGDHYMDEAHAEREFTRYAVQAAYYMCQSSSSSSSSTTTTSTTTLKTKSGFSTTMPQKKKTKKQIWNDFQEKAQLLLLQPQQNQNQKYDYPLSNALAISFVFGALSLMVGKTSEDDNDNDDKTTTTTTTTDSIAAAAKAAASALSSTISRNKPFRHSGRSIANHVLRVYLIHACYSSDDTINYTILTHFAKAFKLTEEDDIKQYPQLVANVIRYGLGLASSSSSTSSSRFTREGNGAKTINDDNNINDNDDNNNNNNNEDDNILSEEEYYYQKQKISGAMALACQIRPWPILSPLKLIEVAIPYSFWHAAEQVCVSAYDKAIKLSPKNTSNNNNCTTATNATTSINGDGGTIQDDMELDSSTTAIATAENKNNNNKALADAILAVETLIDTVMEDKTYRLADTIATKLYKEGGKSRYIEARYYHACDTINKVICKRQLPIIERQVDRVDKAVAKVQGDSGGSSAATTIASSSSSSAALAATITTNTTPTSTTTTTTTSNNNYESDDIITNGPPHVWASSEIRKFALQRLQEEGETEAALRLAGLWGIDDYVYDEEEMLRAAAARRERYLQYDEVIPGGKDDNTIPELISTPLDLYHAFEHQLRQPPYENGPFGFDAEWDEDTKGAEILQLASPNVAILIDIPALSSTKEGCQALRETVGQIFESPNVIVVGFCCRQDLSRLRSSPYYHHDNDYPHSHWLNGSGSGNNSDGGKGSHHLKSIYDAQKLAGKDEPRLMKLGLSEMAKHYLGKPLDKAEQCSLWSLRPLSLKQRAYAALDAWVCAAVYEKLFPPSKEE